MKPWFYLLLPCILLAHTSCSQSKKIGVSDREIIPGADRLDTYLPLIRNKSAAVFANHSSLVGKTHLVDTLLALGVRIKKIFGPEHGFRGNASAGEKVQNQTDTKTGLPIISLYGDHKKPRPAELEDVDLVIFDIQDVGVRFYTYISSLQYVMEACLENDKPLLILDRPNPNGFYVDGPVLERAHSSFVGMQPVPVVYGMTIGEYALMLAGEGWLSEKANQVHAYNIRTNPTPDTPFHLQVIRCLGYDHNSRYQLPVFPSPNLKDMGAVYLYPSTCFFEGTVISEGRGTEKPFRTFGHPDLPKHLFSFTPRANAGAKTGKCFNETCYGWQINENGDKLLKKLDGKIQIGYVTEAYRLFPQKDSFFLKNNFFNKLAGNSELMKQIRNGITETDIRKSWEPGLTRFLGIRKKYLIYPDFDRK